MSAEELAAVRNGVIEFLLRLPQGARTMVVDSSGDPRVVAPLSAGPADALSAVSALRQRGSPATTAGTLLAAETLATAPPGPRAIIVYVNGSDDRGSSVGELAQAVSRAEAVVDVVQTGGDDRWSRVVDRIGGEVHRTDPAQLVQSFGRLATALGDQYLVAFEAPGGLPAMAEVAVTTGDAQFGTVVSLPSAGPSVDAAGQPNERWLPGGLGSILVVLFCLVLMVLAVDALILRARRRASVDGGAFMPPADATRPRTNTPPPDSPPPGALPPASPASPVPRRSRGSLSAAVQGLRSARRDLDTQPIPEASRPPPPDLQRQRAPADKHPPQRATNRAGAKRSDDEGHHVPVVLTGSGDAVVELTKNAPGPAVVHITGNPASNYFGVRTLGTENDLVITVDPYEGVRLLDWDGDDSTGFEVRATGSWRIEMLPLSVVPIFNSSFQGHGNMVVGFTGDGSLAEITGNNEGRYFDVRAFDAYGAYGLVNTNQPYAGSCQISRGPQFFEVQAVGSWTISVK
jgi:hypothetical protein